MLAFDETNFSEGAFEFARCLNELSPVLLTGVFLPQAQIANVWSYAESGSAFIPLLEAEEVDQINSNIEHFEKLCQRNGIDYRVHKDFYDMAIPALKKESLFADIIILGSESFYSGFSRKDQTQYIGQALHDMRCPVLIVPEKYRFPENIILAYDGSSSSVFAIKQFAYLFPELTGKEAILVNVTDKENAELPRSQYIEELAARHFSNLTILNLQLESRHFFHTWLSERPGSLLVCGSYGRSGVSQLFRRSFITEILEDRLLPVFIAHR